jgi:hypothetical protein
MLRASRTVASLVELLVLALVVLVVVALPRQARSKLLSLDLDSWLA